MPDPLEWAKILFGFITKDTQKIVGRVFIVIILVAFYFFPNQYVKYGGIISKAILEQYQKEILVTWSPVIDSLTQAVKR